MTTEFRPDQVGLVPINKAFPALLNTSIVETTVANTITETQVYSFALPAGLLGPNDALVLEAMGKMEYNVSSIPSFKLKLGSVILCNLNGGSACALSGTTVFGVDLTFMLNNNNATNAQKSVGYMMWPCGTTIQATQVSQGSGTVDMTLAQTLSLTLTWSVASASDTYTHMYTSLWYYPAVA